MGKKGWPIYNNIQHTLTTVYLKYQAKFYLPWRAYIHVNIGVPDIIAWPWLSCLYVVLGVFLFVCLTAAVCLAPPPATASPTPHESSSDGRLLFTDGSNTSVTIGSSTITTITLVVLGLLLLMALAALLAPTDAATPYAASASSYDVPMYVYCTFLLLIPSNNWHQCYYNY